MQKLYEITLPLETNSGGDYDEAHEMWRRRALDTVGGYTEQPDAYGAWLDGKADKLYMDRVRAYRVMCSPEQWEVLVVAAFELFTDQVAIFHAVIGQGEILTRGDIEPNAFGGRTILGEYMKKEASQPDPEATARRQSIDAAKTAWAKKPRIERNYP